jgi:LysM repeat protein
MTTVLKFVIMRLPEKNMITHQTCNVNLTDLLALNNLTLNSNPPIGTKLLIPQSGNLWSSGDRALKPHPATYIVLSSDTIYGIACQFGDVFPEEIARVNGLVEPYDLSPGQELEIP